MNECNGWISFFQVYFLFNEKMAINSIIRALRVSAHVSADLRLNAFAVFRRRLEQHRDSEYGYSLAAQMVLERSALEMPMAVRIAPDWP